MSREQEVEGREQREVPPWPVQFCPMQSGRLVGPRVCWLRPALCLPRRSSVGNESWIGIDQTGFRIVILAHHFPSLNLSSTHGVVVRIQEENLGQCLETAEEGDGLALRTVHCGAGKLITAGTVRHW